MGRYSVSCSVSYPHTPPPLLQAWNELRSAQAAAARASSTGAGGGVGDEGGSELADDGAGELEAGGEQQRDIDMEGADHPGFSGVGTVAIYASGPARPAHGGTVRCVWCLVLNAVAMPVVPSVSCHSPSSPKTSNWGMLTVAILTRVYT